MTNNEGNQKYRMIDIVQCNSVSVGALKMTRQKKTHSKYYNILIEIEIIVKLSI